MLLRATECGPERPVSAAVAALIGWVFGWAKNKKRSRWRWVDGILASHRTHFWANDRLPRSRAFSRRPDNLDIRGRSQDFHFQSGRFSVSTATIEDRKADGGTAAGLQAIELPWADLYWKKNMPYVGKPMTRKETQARSKRLGRLRNPVPAEKSADRSRK